LGPEIDVRARDQTACVVMLLACAVAPGADPTAPAAGGPPADTVRAFDTYITVTESRLDALLAEKDSFLWADTPENRARLRQAGVICEPRNGKGAISVTRGLIHDWVGSAFIPGATVDQVLLVVQDYDNHKHAYSPDVLDSRILRRNGNDFQVRLRLFKRKVVSVVLDTDYDIRYEPLGATDWRSRSYSTRIVEIANARTPRERERNPREDHGYLWRLYSYWLFRERDGGVYVECEAVSLSRSVPAALAPIIRPIVQSLPRDALTNTLRRTRDLVPTRRGGS
jgi:hypothetical protein